MKNKLIYVIGLLIVILLIIFNNGVSFIFVASSATDIVQAIANSVSAAATFVAIYVALKISRKETKEKKKDYERKIIPIAVYLYDSVVKAKDMMWYCESHFKPLVYENLSVVSDLVFSQHMDTMLKAKNNISKLGVSDITDPTLMTAYLGLISHIDVVIDHANTLKIFHSKKSIGNGNHKMVYEDMCYSISLINSHIQMLKEIKNKTPY